MGINGECVSAGVRKCVSLLLLLCAVFVVGCQKAELYHDLAEEDANEILVLLTQNGIEAKKTREIRQNQVFWTIAMEPNKLAQARALVAQHNLPRHRPPGLEELYSKSGSLVQGSEEKKARFLLGLKGEIVKFLYRDPDVVSADVVLNVPSQEDLPLSAQKPQRPTASVVLKIRPTEQAMANLTEAKVQRLVANAIENLDPRDVAVIITYTAPPPQGVLPGQSILLPSDIAKQGPKGAGEPGKGPLVTIGGLEVSTASSGRLKVYFGIFLGLLALLSLGLIVSIAQAVRSRRALGGTSAEGGPAIEGKVIGEAPRLGPGL